MRGHTAVQGLDELGARGFQATSGEIRQALGIGFAGNERPQDRAATRAQDVAHDAGQLQIGVLQRLLNSSV